MPKGLTYERILLTPKLAAELLKNQAPNRPLSPVHLERMKNKIRNGEWIKDAHNIICINSQGKMNNGQHRCHAVIETGISMWVTLEYNMDYPETVDVDKHRSPFEQAKILRPDLAVSKAGSYCIQFFRDSYSGDNAKVQITALEIIDILERHWSVFNNVTRKLGGNVVAPISAAVIKACLVENSEVPIDIVRGYLSDVGLDKFDVSFKSKISGVQRTGYKRYDYHKMWQQYIMEKMRAAKSGRTKKKFVLNEKSSHYDGPLSLS